MRLAPLLALLVACGLAAAAAACGPEISTEPRDLLLTPGDFQDVGVSVLSLTEEQSLDGPSAQVDLQGPGYRVVQSIVLYENRDKALAALDGIRADLVRRGEAGPGAAGSSGVLEHLLGLEEAASLFFIEHRALVRMTVSGDGREERLSELADAARKKLSEG